MGVADDGTKLEYRCPHARRPRARDRGPFAWIRHPIYTGMFLMMIALAIGLGHVARLLIALPLYTLGTAIRVRIEERLLRTAFSSAYEEYANRVKRFIPGVL